MIPRLAQGWPQGSGHESTVWIDRERALIVGRDAGGLETVQLLERGKAESAARFDARAIDQVVDDDRVVVSGPTDARAEFERAYVAVTQRPDRLVDLEPTSPVIRPVSPLTVTAG